jgi:hypothetical protein
MQASRTAHYAWLYRSGSRGSQRGQANQVWPTEVLPKTSASASQLRARIPLLARTRAAERGTSQSHGHELAGEASAIAARAHFIDAQVRAAVESGIRQLVWLTPRPVAPERDRAEVSRDQPRPAQSQSSTQELDIEVEVFRLEAGGAGRGVRALLDRSLVRSASTLFVCDGLLDRIPSAQIQAILRTIGESCYGSRLVFVYLDGGVTSGNLSIGGNHKPRCAVPRLGEPSRAMLGIETRALPGLLACAGLVLDADVGLTEYARRALGEVSSDLRGHSCRLAMAHVRSPAAAPDAEIN